MHPRLRDPDPANRKTALILGMTYLTSRPSQRAVGLLLVAAATSLAAACVGGEGGDKADETADSLSFVGGSECAECHEREATAWPISSKRMGIWPWDCKRRMPASRPSASI